MTEKRFTTDNGSNEDVTLVDNVTGKEYESNFDDIVDLLNEQHELILQGFEELAKANDEKFDYKMKVKKTLQKRYNHLQKTQQETEKPPRYLQGAIMEIEVIADCLGVELK